MSRGAKNAMIEEQQAINIDEGTINREARERIARENSFAVFTLQDTVKAAIDARHEEFNAALKEIRTEADAATPTERAGIFERANVLAKRLHAADGRQLAEIEAVAAMLEADRHEAVPARAAAVRVLSDDLRRGMLVAYGNADAAIRQRTEAAYAAMERLEGAAAETADQQQATSLMVAREDEISRAVDSIIDTYTEADMAIRARAVEGLAEIDAMEDDATSAGDEESATLLAISTLKKLATDGLERVNGNMAKLATQTAANLSTLASYATTASPVAADMKRRAQAAITAGNQEQYSQLQADLSRMIVYEVGGRAQAMRRLESEAAAAGNEGRATLLGAAAEGYESAGKYWGQS